MDKQSISIEILDKVGSYPLKFTLPILFSVGSDFQTLIFNNGSVTFLDLGKGKFLITCYHVIESFLEKLKNMSATERPLFQVGNFSIYSRPMIIDQCKTLDLVTIKITENEHKLMQSGYSQEIGDSFITSIESSKININDQISFAGYPGEWRCRSNPGHIRFHSFSFISAFITAVRDNEVICQIDDFHHQDKISGNKDRLEQPGGLSGCPVFLNKSTETGIQYWSFIGIIREGTFIEETLFIYIRLTKINPDGTIIN